MEPIGPYSAHPRRVKSITIKDVKVNKEPAIRIAVAWEEQREDLEWDGHRYQSTNAPAREEFWRKLDALVTHALQLLHLPETYRDNVGVVKVGFTYDGDSTIAEVHCRKLLTEGSGAFVTPKMADTGDYLVFQTAEYRAALMDVQAGALFYVG